MAPRGKGYDEALRRIAEAKKRKAEDLDLAHLGLTELPPGLGQLTSLQQLYLHHNQLTSLPPGIGQLASLRELDLGHNQLTSLPPGIGQLASLQRLGLSGNQLTSLPPEFGQLASLQRLHLDDNPLRSPEPSVIHQGTQAVLEYLKALDIREPVWRSKLLVVGEGGVGKTSLLRALRGDEFCVEEDTTHGVEVGDLELAHPTQDVTMKLTFWDFGGQTIYHATHQFFLSDRSLFVLVWNARHGFEQGKLYYWLDMIRAKAPKSPVTVSRRTPTGSLAGFSRTKRRSTSHC